MIREAAAADWAAIWPILSEVGAVGETLTWDPGTTEARARAGWMRELPGRTIVAVDNDGSVIGSANTHPNHRGPGAHVANAGFVVDPARRGEGVGRALCSYVLEQARAGADFKAVVVFHVTNPNPVVAGTPCNIKGRVLAVHGSADPVTPKPMMDAFEEELTKANVDWQIMMFGGAVHSFCDPTVHAGPTRYDEKLCRKSYMLMRDFFAETL